MPAIRGVYYEHPITSEPGYWIWGAWGDNPIIGISQEQLDNIQLIGAPANRPALLERTARLRLLADAEHRIVLSGWTVEDLEAKAADPPPYTTVDVATGERVIQPIEITIRVVSLDIPRRIELEVSDGAHTSSTVYG